jgi:hypothetical protein
MSDRTKNPHHSPNAIAKSTNVGLKSTNVGLKSAKSFVFLINLALRTYHLAVKTANASDFSSAFAIASPNFEPSKSTANHRSDPLANISSRSQSLISKI